MKVEALDYGERKVYSVSSFNRGIADWLSRLPTIWVDGTKLEGAQDRETLASTLDEAIRAL